jgi:uncharacterized membrane protein
LVSRVFSSGDTRACTEVVGEWGVLRVVVAAIGMLPLVAWLARFMPLLLGVARALEPWFDFQCHRDPQRTLSLLGQRFPVCARCAGIYVGLLLGAAIVSRAPRRRLVQAMALGVVAIVADVGTEALGLRIPSLGLRTATGVLLAYPASCWVVREARGCPS